MIDLLKILWDFYIWTWEFSVIFGIGLTIIIIMFIFLPIGFTFMLLGPSNSHVPSAADWDGSLTQSNSHR